MARRPKLERPKLSEFYAAILGEAANLVGSRYALLLHATRKIKASAYDQRFLELLTATLLSSHINPIACMAWALGQFDQAIWASSLFNRRLQQKFLRINPPSPLMRGEVTSCAELWTAERESKSRDQILAAPNPRYTAAFIVMFAAHMGASSVVEQHLRKALIQFLEPERVDVYREMCPKTFLSLQQYLTGRRIRQRLLSLRGKSASAHAA